MADTENTRDPRSRAGARGPFALLVVAAIALVAAVSGAAACLPDLSAIPADEGGTSPPFVGCGDGVIATLDDGGDAGESCDPGKADAQPPGCKSCQIVCEGTLDRATNHCYFALPTEESSYNDARTQCAAAGAHVVTFASNAEVALVEGIEHDRDAGFWVGLSRTSNFNDAYGPDRAEEPGFPYPPAGVKGPCDGCFGLGADAGVFPIADRDAASPTCLASRGGGWFQVECSEGAKRTTICEREPVGVRAQDCFGGFCFTLSSTVGKKSYLVIVSRLDPDQAAQSCAALDGGSLVFLDSAEEREQLAHEILARDPTAAEQQLWIGLVADDAGAWSWDDGVPATPDGARPLPWGNEQPGAQPRARAFMRLAATAYDTELAYADDGGRAPRLYVCQRPP